MRDDHSDFIPVLCRRRWQCSESKGTSGAAGFFTGLLILSEGIVSIVQFKKDNNGLSFAVIAVFTFGALIDFTLHDNFSDLMIYIGWYAICVILAIILIALKKTKKQ